MFAECGTHPHLHPLLFSEQYESFVKFTQDQIMRRYGARPASCEYCYLYLLYVFKSVLSLKGLPLL